MHMKRFFSSPWAMVLLISLFIGSVFGVVASANTAVYTLYYAEADKEELKAIFDDGEKQSDIGDKMVIAAKGGFFGDEGFNFVFSPAVNDQLNRYDGIREDNHDEYYAVAPVFCTNDGASTTRPSTRPYFAIDYVLGFKLDNWDSVQNPDNYKTYAGITKVTKINSGGTANEELHIKKANTGPDNLGHNDPNKDSIQSGGGEGENLSDILPGNCLSALTRGDVGNKTRNYWKLSEAERQEVDTIINAGGGASAGGASGEAQTGTNCQGGPMGWLFCPLINAMAKVLQLSSQLIEELMTVRFLTNDSSASAIEQAWRAFLTLANLLLVVAFLIIIFSQATGAGLSNYNIKRMLPRLVVAAILMNFSFYICAFAIDVSNIVGASIMGFFLGSGNSISQSITDATGGSDGNLISGVLVIGVAIIALLFFLLVPVVLSIVAVLITLIARQIILMGLVLISPLAFVAWLLPNTEKYFKKWFDMFLQMLILYPMVMFVFGISLYMSNLIGSPEGGSSIIGG